MFRYIATCFNLAPTAKDYETEEIWIKDLVPGDIVVIPPAGVQLSFDAALISGMFGGVLIAQLNT